jgi:hypothetical protein
MQQPTVINIVKDFLVRNGYAGLCHTDCGCGIDDIACCEHINEHCVAAYQVDCTTCADLPTCELNQGEDKPGVIFIENNCHVQRKE